jgi:GT2 family glycosyltransferase
MIDIVDELKALIAKFDEQDIEYAVCGGMAMGIHGFLRMTMDIDFMILPDALEAVLQTARTLGYTIRGKDLSFKDGAVEIRRMSKIDPAGGDILPLDFLLVTPATQKMWESRIRASWEAGRLFVVSRDALIELKKLRGSGQDLADIERLTGEDDA